MADVRRRIVNVATQEWGFFSYQVVDMAFVEEREVPRGIVPDELNPKFPKPRIERQALRVGIFQDTPGVDATIGGYWSATPSGKGILAAQNAAWNQGGDAINWVQPWSAAFISWVMCESGLGNPKQFQRSAAHRDYIDQAIRAHDGKHPDAVYVAYDAGEQPITPGDMLCNARGTKDYRTLADRRRDIGAGAAVHCDIVVKVTPKHIFTIGGNVLKSVSLTILPVTKGKGAYERPVAKDDMGGANTVFAHLKLHAPPIEANALDNAPTIQALRGKVTAAAAAHAAKPKSAAH
ncbi:MAG: DUF2272 domain-containing protein [Rhizomicrobium sp.]